MGGWRASTVKASLAVTKLGSCASSERAWRLWAARHSQGEASPLGAQPLPRVLERAASQAAYFTAFDHSGPGRVVSVLEGISNPCFNPGPCFNPDPCFNLTLALTLTLTLAFTLTLALLLTRCSRVATASTSSARPRRAAGRSRARSSARTSRRTSPPSPASTRARSDRSNSTPPPPAVIYRRLRRRLAPQPEVVRDVASPGEAGTRVCTLLACTVTAGVF